MAGADVSDQLVRCWALGIRIHETAQYLAENAKAMADSFDEVDEKAFREKRHGPGAYGGAYDIRHGILTAQLANLDDLLTKSEECGVEANGHIGGEFATLRDAVGGAGGTFSPKRTLSAAREFLGTLHGDAVDEIAGTIEMTGEERAKHLNEHGRMLFDDPAVEETNRFIEENGPEGVWHGENGEPSEQDIEEVRELTGNPNFGRPRSEWV